MPFGRECKRSWRLVFGTLKGNIFVGDFRAAGRVTAATATTVRIVGRGGVALEVIAAGARCAATAARGSAFGAATQHAEIVRNNLAGCPLLNIKRLPLPRMKEAFQAAKGSPFQILVTRFGR